MSPAAAAARTIEPVTLSARSVRSGLDTICDPEARDWERAGELLVGLEPTPLDRQPSAYVQTSWAHKPPRPAAGRGGQGTRRFERPGGPARVGGHPAGP